MKYYVVPVREVCLREVIIKADSPQEAKVKARSGDWVTAGDPEYARPQVVGDVKEIRHEE
jgi:hypothetical protein